MEKEEREMIQLNKQEFEAIREILGLKNTKCHYCKNEFAEKYLIFSKPTRLICNSPLCIAKALNEDETP